MKIRKDVNVIITFDDKPQMAQINIKRAISALDIN